jgi:DNA polymerase III epsilon subunit-like protein
MVVGFSGTRHGLTVPQVAAIDRDALRVRAMILLDTETTGLLPHHRGGYTLDAEPRIVSIAAVTLAGDVLGYQRCNPGVPIPPESTAIHGLADADVAAAPRFADVWPRLLARVGEGALVCAHNAAYDRAVIATELLRAGLPLPRWRWACTMRGARAALPHAPRHTLVALADVLRLDGERAHHSLGDARTAAALARELDARLPTWRDDVTPWHPLPEGRVVAVTGHRAITAADAEVVDAGVRRMLDEGVTRWVFGGASGVDTVALLAAWRPGRECTVIVPGTVAQQPPEARAAIRERADHVVEMRGNLATREVYWRRNEALVAAASEVLGFTDGGPSGTRHCLETAREQARAVRVVAISGRDW